MTFRLYMDEDSMSSALVNALRARGIDIVTAFDAQMIERDDSEHFDYATQQGRVLCTFNVGDFYRPHKVYLNSGKEHAGMILIRQQEYSVGEQMRRILNLGSVRSAQEMRNQVEFLSAWK